VGGQSGVFGSAGLLPLYDALSQVDCVQWAANTTWHKLDPRQGFAPDGRRLGELHIADDVELPKLEDGSYDIVFSSHVIEHIANPLRALAAWRRVTVADGLILVIAPHMEGTFDHRRPLTTVEHMVGDFDAGTAEDDLTHLDETLGLHDRSRDVVADLDRWQADRRANSTTRLLHHHTFTTLTLGALLRRSGAEILGAETRLPHEIFIIGCWGGTAPDGGAGVVAEAARESPFRADRRAARTLDPPAR
jgi:SAM-dependent methyltransferase